MTPLRYVDRAPFLLAGLRRRHDHGTAATSIAAQWAAMADIELPTIDTVVAYGAICGHEPGGFEYLSGREVLSFEALPDSLGRMRVPAQRYAVFAHDGAVATLAETWRTALMWLAAGPCTSAEAPDFERYGPGFDAQRGDGDIEVWLGIVPRTGRCT